MGIAFEIPEDSPVRLLWEVLEGIDFAAFESGFKRSRNSTADAREMTGLLVFGAMNGVYSSRKLEEAGNNDIRYMWLLGGKRAPDHSTIARFRAERLPLEMAALFGQLLKRLCELGETDYETVFIDGTKLEANANRYSFVWKKSVERHLSRLREKAVALTRSTEASPAALRALAEAKRAEMAALGLVAVSGSGRRKSAQQKTAEELEAMAAKWEGYERHLGIMGPGRNSYSKTDHDATFMRMKDDHMRNGQLKAAYNLQLAVNGEYIVGYGAFEDRNDSGTMIPFLKALEALHGKRYKSITADAGYESHENYAYLDAAEQLSFVKPANYESNKKKNKKWIGRFENMDYDARADSFTCPAGKTLRFTGKRTRTSKTGYESMVSIYTCKACAGCPLRPKCSRAQDATTKQLQVCWDFELHRARSLANITSEKGICYRVNRSIQVEGAFGVLKQDWGFRRFLTRGKQNILTEFGILAFAFNVKKLHTKRQQNRSGTQLFEANIA